MGLLAIFHACFHTAISPVSFSFALDTTLSPSQLSPLSALFVFMLVSAARSPARILVFYGSTLILESLIPIERWPMSTCARSPLAHIRSFVVKSLGPNEFGLSFRGSVNADVYADTFEVEHVTLFVHGEAFAGFQYGRWTTLLSSPRDCLGVGLGLREVAQCPSVPYFFFSTSATLFSSLWNQLSGVLDFGARLLSSCTCKRLRRNMVPWIASREAATSCLRGRLAGWLPSPRDQSSGCYYLKSRRCHGVHGCT
jgi:hypothetical protein